VTASPLSARRAGKWTALATSVWLTAVWAVLAPLLVPLPERATIALVALSPVAAVVVGVLAATAARRGGSVARRASQAGRRALILGVALAFAAAAALVFPAGAVPAVCLGAVAIGGALGGAVAATLAAFHEARGRSGRGTAYRRMIAGAVALLGGATWLAAGGHAVATAEAAAREEARGAAIDLAGVGGIALRSGEVSAAKVARAVAPRDGFAVIFDEQGKPAASAGVEYPDSLDPSREGCLVGYRRLPCAARSLADGRRVVVGVSPAATAERMAVALGLGGDGLFLLALLLAWSLARTTSGELDRMTAHLAQLQSHGWGLDRPVGVTSADELGVLAVALGSLRGKLERELARSAQSLARASEADKQQGDFLAMVGAELREPLELILARASALAAAGHLVGEQAKDLELILNGARELNGLIDAVLGLTANDAGRVDLKLGAVDVAALANEVARSQRPLVAQRKLALSVETIGDVPPVRADGQRLRQVITNLVTNALKFTDEGKVVVQVHHDRERVVVEVRDQGGGIPPEMMPRLFHEFEQGGSGGGARTLLRGTGLGLAICKRLVEAHGGAISVESRPGQGSTFRIALPVDGPPDAAPPRTMPAVTAVARDEQSSDRWTSVRR
jgi:signal transduction histidine kinase